MSNSDTKPKSKSVIHVDDLVRLLDPWLIQGTYVTTDQVETVDPANERET